MYCLYIKERGKFRRYGFGEMYYIRQLLYDYLVVHDMYDANEIEFKIERIFGKGSQSNGEGMTEKELIEKIVSIRKSKKITQVDVSKVSGLTQQQVSGLERMDRSPTLNTLTKYCDAVGVYINVLEKGDV